MANEKESYRLYFLFGLVFLHSLLIINQVAINIEIFGYTETMQIVKYLN